MAVGRPSDGNALRGFAILLLGCAMSVATACTSNTAKPREDGFPVVEPFAVDKAGSKATVEFNLPEAIDPSTGQPRPVFIGFRAVRGAGMSPESNAMIGYFDEAPIPLRLLLWRLDGETHQPVLLQKHRWEQDELHRYRSWHEPHPGDVYKDHNRFTLDVGQAPATLDHDPSKVYIEHEIARIDPPTPGRYRLEVESLEDHPVLHPDRYKGHPALASTRYELFVGHYNGLGVK